MQMISTQPFAQAMAGKRLGAGIPFSHRVVRHETATT
jgi:hypothetical protein